MGAYFWPMPVDFRKPNTSLVYSTYLFIEHRYPSVSLGRRTDLFIVFN